MKYLVLAISFLTLAGCSNDIIDIEQAVIQQHNLEDLDADGVIEAREKCADTFLGANIDNNGCSSVKRIDDSITLKINFANNSAAINQTDYEKIKEVSDFMNKFPGSHVTIEGHCSRQGSAELNQKLSESRANAVANVLKNQYGIAAFRVAAVGHGFDKLLDENDSPEAHSKNRRIVASLSGTEQSTAMKWTIYTADGL
ncbi:MAG: hypothetical protein BM565_03935 [Gammaproteobacteria bacterium MedPE]|nr:MAG: hypothetical protein BM565_03935 [Gammaproteobacteria bacterium MedPE]